MKRQSARLKLRLDRETLVPLSADAVANVQGGATIITVTTVTVTTTLITHPIVTCK